MRIFFVLTFAFLNLTSFSQEKPKLVVGIVIDQMRQEYLERFEKHFSEEGFKKLQNEGFSYKNMHYNYVPTYTGPGHTSIYTGTTPFMHGIIANDWYDKVAKKEVYCAEDENYNTVGSESDNGKMSPHRLLTSTIADEINISQQFKSQSIGISIKDRGAIFPAGHSGQAYWYDKSNGKFITSDFYLETLPKWLQKFNDQNLAQQYMKQGWKTLLDIKEYQESGSDNNDYETGFYGKKPEFPYNFKNDETQYKYLPATPHGNSILKDMAIAVLENTGIGQGKTTDFLSISFSSTDYVGHQFGPNSVEIEDTYIRLDQDIAAIIQKLDEKVGKGNYILFLTADHAVAEVPQYLKDHKIPAGVFNQDVTEELDAAIDERFGASDWIESISNMQVFLSREACKKNEADLNEVRTFVAEYLLGVEGVFKTYTAQEIHQMPYNAEGLSGLLHRGYNQQRSGDVLVSFNPGWFPSKYEKGTTHGSAFTYDTHVPMLWYGANISKGQSFRKSAITNIVPTISMMLGVKLPNGAMDEPLYELLRHFRHR